MKVKLKKTIMEGGGVKASVRKNRNWHPPKVSDGEDGKKIIEECKENETVVIAFIEGIEIEVSDTTGKKWIDKGWAEEVKESIPTSPKPEPKPESKPEPLKEKR